MLSSLKGYFPDLQFDEESHTYWVDGEVYPSVSTLLKNFYKPFDQDGVAYGYARKHGFNVEEVKQAWAGKNKRSTDTGSAIHKFGEDYAYHRYFGVGEKPVVPDKQGLGIVQFFNDLPDYIEVVDLELQMYSKVYKYCGTGDILMYNHKAGYYLWGDFKTNESLWSQYNTAPLLILPPELGLLQDNFGKYSCQFSFYQILLEDMGINVGSRVLIWLQEQEDKKLYKTFKTQDVTKHLRQWLETRRH